MRLGAAALEHEQALAAAAALRWPQWIGEVNEQAIAGVHDAPGLALDLLPHLRIADGEVEAGGPAGGRIDRAALATDQKATFQGRGGVGDPVEVAGQGRQAHHRQQRGEGRHRGHHAGVGARLSERALHPQRGGLRQGADTLLQGFAAAVLVQRHHRQQHERDRAADRQEQAQASPEQG